MVLLAASICTRGGKAILSRSFREISRARIEGLLAGFPKLADSGTQHTVVEQDNVRFVYQALDELYMVLITNRQSNILQDIDSLHIFAQVTTSLCRTLDEREITRNAFELLSAFDELCNLGYRENLTLAQIKTFLDMESHEERVALIIESNKQMEATEQRKLRAKQIEMQRREQSRATRGQMPRTPAYPTYTPPVQAATVDPMDSYAAEKNRSSFKPTASSGKGMQLGKKAGRTMYDKVRGELPEEPDQPLVTPAVAAPITTKAAAAAAARPSMTGDREAIHITVAEQISAQLARDGSVESFEVKGDLQLRISDASVTQVKLQLVTNDKTGAQFTTHPKVDKNVFTKSKTIQLKDTSRGFPANNSALGVMRWRMVSKSGEGADLPLSLTAWVNQGSGDSYSITLEYELTGGDTLRDVVVAIPFGSSEPSVSSTDAIFEVSGDQLDWTIGTIDAENSTGSFDFEAEADSDSAFFPMTVAFSKQSPFVDIDVSSVTLLNMNQELPFSKDVKSVAERYIIS